MFRVSILHVAASAALALAAVVGVAGQSESERTVLDGVYTAEQAALGEVEYNDHCAECHAPDLGGGGAAPALHALEFLDRWREDSLSSLYQYIQTNMPLEPGPGPGGLKESQYLDIVAYILSRNDLPAGSEELSAADIGSIRLVGLDGPQPLPANATVRAVGCLTHSAGTWTLARTATPSRVRKGDTTDPAELALSSATALGTEDIRLSNAGDDIKEAVLLPQVSKKVQVKGVLNGQGAAARLFVLSFSPLDMECQP